MCRIMRGVLLLMLCVAFINQGYSQYQTTEKPMDGAIFDFGLGLGANLPLGDMKERFGSNLGFSVGSNYILPSNWLFNGEFIYYYSDDVKEDVLAPFRTSTGLVLGDDDQIADVFLRQRGFYLGAGVGKLFPLKPSSRSGIKFLLSGGVLQHQIIFVDDRNAVPMLRVGRHKGYDRLTRGFALKETVTYKHISRDRRINFDVGFDFVQGFTSEVRAYNFDTGLPTIQDRLDLIIGARFVWYLAFYRGGNNEEIFY